MYTGVPKNAIPCLFSVIKLPQQTTDFDSGILQHESKLKSFNRWDE